MPFDDSAPPDDSTETDGDARSQSPSLGGDGRGCPKCGHADTETDSISTTGSGFSKLFDLQNRKFTVVSCANCGYSELYKGRSSGDVIDFFLGG